MLFPQIGDSTMDTQELYRRGLAIRKEIFGKEAVDKRMAAVGDYGAPLQNIVNAYAYGDIWARPGMERKMRSLVVLAMTAAINRPAEFKVHVNGALNNGLHAGGNPRSTSTDRNILRHSGIERRASYRAGNLRGKGDHIA